jgi:hypothetical protein
MRRLIWLSILLVACVGQAPDDGTGGAPDAGIVVPDAGPGAADAAPATPDAGTTPSCYDEPVFPAADIDDLIAAYGGADWKDDLIAAMDRRHPATGWLLEQQRNDSYFGQFSDPNSWTGMVGWLDTLAHEETHLFNASHAADVGQVHAIYHREDLIYYLPSDPGFGRGEIFDDITADARGGIYAPTYLQGSQGDRGFNALLDEQAAYLNELAAVGPVGEHFQGGVSLRDGSVAFLYFIEVYLRVARTEFPAIYDQLKAEPAYRDAVETAWLRTHFFLEIADAFPNLGVDDQMYRSQAHRQENLDELELFLGHPVAASACLP